MPNDNLNKALDAHEDAVKAAYSNLDGKTPVKPTPFDAHEQATRGTHVPTTADSPDVPAGQEYPKAVDHVDGEPVIATSEEHEEQLAAAKQDEKAS